MNKFRQIVVELTHHLPFSIFGVVSAIIFMGVLTFFAEIGQAAGEIARGSRELFHLFHPFHILFSSMTTTAVFWKHDNHHGLKALVIGFFGSVTICGISDIIVPYFGGMFLGHHMHFHICLIQEPWLVYPFAVLGCLTGLFMSEDIEHATQYSHSVHVFLSSAASLLFLIGFGLYDWMHAVTGVFFVTIVAVMFPCCLSDIVFPMLCTHRYCRHGK